MLWIIIILAVIVTTSHAVGLIWAQHNKAYFKIRKRAWRWHFFINGALWLLLSISFIVAQFYFNHEITTPLLIIGTPVAIIGLYLIVVSHLTLGLERVMGKRFFFPEDDERWIESGLYRYLANPMYDGFVLLLVGLGLMFSIKENFYFAPLSFILLNGFLSLIESKGRKWRLI